MFLQFSVDNLNHMRAHFLTQPTLIFYAHDRAFSSPIKRARSTTRKRRPQRRPRRRRRRRRGVHFECFALRVRRLNIRMRLKKLKKKNMRLNILRLFLPDFLKLLIVEIGKTRKAENRVARALLMRSDLTLILGKNDESSPSFGVRRIIFAHLAQKFLKLSNMIDGQLAEQLGQRKIVAARCRRRE